MAVKSYTDAEFGDVVIRYHPQARGIGFRYTPAGLLAITAPPRTPVFLLKQALNTSRRQIRRLRDTIGRPIYRDEQEIGKSHRLRIIASGVDQPQIALSQRLITATIPVGLVPDDPSVQSMIRQKILPILRKEAKAYLPRRLKLLAERYGYRYETVRFSHASSRWGSCSSRGTISLNIALMSLPLDLIDYVLVHELCHTVEMNHSLAFWRRVGEADPDYTLHRKQLKAFSPHL